VPDGASSSPVEEQFAELVEELVGEPGVTPPGEGRGFGSDTLRVGGKTFAMVVHDRLVLKLPRATVDALVDEHAAERLEMRGRRMKEWASLEPGQEERWPDLARAALAFVRPVG
jgi:hypothetical protein